MTTHSLAILGILALVLAVTLQSCSPLDAPASDPDPATPYPSVVVIPPTPTFAPSPTMTPNPTATHSAIPTPAPFEMGFRLMVDIEDPAAVRQIFLRGQIFDVEIAATRDERARGLMHRESLAANAGMLFVFWRETTLYFWMKDTLIPLDILYMDATGVVVDIQTMIPQPGTPDAELPTYPSAAPAQYALEINAGLAEAHGFRVGDQAYFQ